MDSPPSLPNALILGALLAVAVSALGYKQRWLSVSGSIVAVPIGAALFSAGWTTTSALLFFFLSSALLARLFRSQSNLSPSPSQQHAPRTASQVLAVGGIPALAAVFAEFGSCAACIPASLAALAFATSDTWATEVGMTSHAQPRMLGLGRRVPLGLSGGMTLRGTLAAVAGAVAIGLIAARLGIKAMSIVAAAGFVGSLVDSLLGATVQKRYVCAQCALETEERRHCDVPTVIRRRGLSNAAVNLVTSAGIAVLVLLVMQ